MLTFQAEPLARVKEEAPALARAHWDEVEASMHGGPGYSLNLAQYASLEQLDMLVLVTARQEDGRLCGYAAFTVLPCPHRQGVTLAALDGLYLAPEARRGLAALGLLREAEKILIQRGVDLVQYSSPDSRPCDALYRRLGARRTETVWHRELGRHQQKSVHK